MRPKFLLAIGVLSVIIAVTPHGLTQQFPGGGEGRGRRGGGGGGFPGGGGGMRGMGGMPDPNMIWNMIAQGKESISKADVTDPRMARMFDMMPTQNGVITRQQFVANFGNMMQQAMRGQMGGGGPATPGATPGATPPTPGAPGGGM